MSSLNVMFNNNWHTMRPSPMLDQHLKVGWDLSDILSPINCIELPSPAGYDRPWRSANANTDAGSTITVNKGKFHVNLDLKQFIKPEETTVKVSGNNNVTVGGKHDGQRDEHGFVFRRFISRYNLSDGQDVNNNYIHIQQPGVPSKALNNNKKQNNEKPKIQD